MGGQQPFDESWRRLALRGDEAALRRLWASRAELPRMGEAARRHALGEHSWERRIAAALGRLDDITGGSHATI